MALKSVFQTLFYPSSRMSKRMRSDLGQRITQNDVLLGALW